LSSGIVYLTDEKSKEETKMAKFNILSLDGGGVRGIITATILTEVEKVTQSLHQQNLGEYFDLVTGTSTGSLITAMIARGMTADEIVKKYFDLAKQVFPQKKSELIAEKLGHIPWIGRSLKSVADKISAGSQQLETYEYDNKPLIKILKDILGEETTLDELAPNHKPLVVIPAYNLGKASFVEFNNSPSGGYGGIPAWQACLASAAAPVYLPRVDIGGWAFIDGGVAVNNPSLLATAFALDTYPDLTLDDIRIVSVGTGSSKKSFTLEDAQKWHPISWAMNVTDIFMEPPIEVIECITHTLFNRTEKGRYLRLNFDLNTEYDSDKQEDRTEFKNRYTGEKLFDRIDYAEEGSLKSLEKAAKHFIKEEEVKERLTEFL
jgi:hypothetical protein